MKLKTSLLVLLCVLSGMVLVGCSGGDAPSTPAMPSTNMPSTNK